MVHMRGAERVLDVVREHNEFERDQYGHVTQLLQTRLDALEEKIADNKLRTIFSKCSTYTFDKHLMKLYEEGGKPKTFLMTGDYPEMWLRDSARQVEPFISYAKEDVGLQRIVKGLIHQQAEMINSGPYANAFYFNRTKVNEARKSEAEMAPGVHERKFELDSLLAFIHLSLRYAEEVGDLTFADEQWHKAVRAIYDTLRYQQQYNGTVPGDYRFTRQRPYEHDVVPNNGYGNPSAGIGLIRSAHRPSDDACKLPFLVPANIFAAVTLDKLSKLYEEQFNNRQFAQELSNFSREIEKAIGEHAVYDHPKYGIIYAYEIDGMGNFNLMDDANYPSLLSIPYLDPTGSYFDREINGNTKQFVLSEDNPHYYSNSIGLEGVGSPHSGKNRIWPMALMMQILTSGDDQEISDCLKMLIKTATDEMLMPETVHVHHKGAISRPDFAWANSMCVEVVKYLEVYRPYLLQLAYSDNL